MDRHNNEVGIKLGKEAKTFDDVVKGAQRTIDDSRDGGKPNGRDDKAPKVEGGLFQETFNGIGGRRYDDWQPLKVDNWIDPKTTEAFGKVLKDEDADELTRSFGKGLGLL